MSQPTLTRKQRKAATRRALLDAGRACFEEAGYAATSIGDMARRAGVAHGTFYVHFASKDALLDELLDAFNQQLAAQLSPLLAAAVPERRTVASRDKLVREVASIFLSHWEQHRAFVECYAERSAAGLSVAALRDGLNPPMVTVLRAALQSAAGSGEDFELATHALLAMWLRVGMQYLFAEGITRRRAQETLVRMTLGAVDALMAPEERS